MEKRLVKMSVGDIVPYKNNPRKNSAAVEVVAESIRQTEYNNPIIVDEDNVILAGHTRLAALKKRGIEEVDVLQVTGLTDEQKRKYRLLDNKAGEYSKWDYVALPEELEGLDWQGLDLDWGVNGSVAEEPEDEPEAEAKEEEYEYECPECGYRFNA